MLHENSKTIRYLLTTIWVFKYYSEMTKYHCNSGTIKNPQDTWPTPSSPSFTSLIFKPKPMFLCIIIKYTTNSTG